MNQRDTSYFIQKTIKIFGNWFNMKESIYINNSTYLKVICPIHGSFKIEPNRFYKHGCSGCNRELKTRKLINKAIQKHGDKFDYSMVPKNATGEDIVNLSCATHGLVKYSLRQHINTKSGCPECAPTRKQTLNEIIARATKQWDSLYTYPTVQPNYKNTDFKLEVICKKHGSFYKKVYNHIGQKQGCPRCTRYIGEATIDKYLVDNNINFEVQKRFKDCINKKPLPFDFYIPDKNLLIEYDGTPHFKPIDIFGGQVYYEVIQKHDKIKTDYCLKEGITLERINYKENIINRLKEIL